MGYGVMDDFYLPPNPIDLKKKVVPYPNCKTGGSAGIESLKSGYHHFSNL